MSVKDGRDMNRGHTVRIISERRHSFVYGIPWHILYEFIVHLIKNDFADKEKNRKMQEGLHDVTMAYTI